MSDIIKQLKDYLRTNPAIERLFEKSFQRAKGLGIRQFEEYKIHTLSDYINFYETLLSWTPREDSSGKNIYYHLAVFYFVLDLGPIKYLQTPISPLSFPPWTWLSQWLIRYAKEVGKVMDTPESITKETLATFYKASSYHMEDYPVPSGGWKTFNEFFARKINLDVRPVDSRDDPTVIVSPADATFEGWWPIDPFSEVTFDVKHIPWSISRLLDGSEYGGRFKNGVFLHTFLTPSDYHRQHAPVAGKVLEAKVIEGLCYLDVVATKGLNGEVNLAMHRKIERRNTATEGDVDAEWRNEAGYQFLQARGLIVLDNPDIGLVAVLPIGMAQVSSVKLCVDKGDVVPKGGELSYFQMGGSDVVLVFEAASKVKITAKKDVHYNFGQKIGTAERIHK